MSYTNGLDDPTQFFNTVLYTGNGSTQSISGVGFAPDFLWIKNRGTSSNHALIDSVRGLNSLRSNTTGAEFSNSYFFSSLDSDGFTFNDTETDANASGANYVAWNFLAGGTAVTNTDGDITSQVSANPTSGFSIVSYTGNGIQDATVGHGLGTTPNMIIFKNRSIVKSWRVWHSGLSGSTYYLNLNDTFAESSSSTVINGQSSTTFTVGTDTSTNGSTNNMIAYCFAEKKGFSKFGSYTGNGSTDGTFVYTGFKPAFVMAKMTSSTGNWSIFDNKRSSFNVVDEMIKGNDSQAELADSTRKIDFNSSGFKIRANHADINTSGGTYIYMAFAENPLVTSTGVPCTAR